METSNTSNETGMTDGIAEIYVDEDKIVFTNNHIALTVNSKGKISSLVDQTTGSEKLVIGQANAVAYLTEGDKTKVSYPQSVSFLEDGSLHVLFQNGGSADLKVSVYPEVLVVSVEGIEADGFYSLTYFDLFLRSNDEDDKDPFRAFGYAMKTNTNTVYYPSDYGRVSATCYSGIGTEDSRFAVVACRQSRYEEALRAVNQYIDKGEMNVSAAGGAWAKTADINYKTYSILTDIDPSEVAGLAKNYAEQGIGLINFHYGTIFTQGEMAFNDKYGGVAGFKEKVVDVFAANGIACGLHTYASYLQASSKYLSIPKYQKDLSYFKEYTLLTDIRSNDRSILLKEGYDNFSLVTGYSIKNSTYLLIGEEIIQFRRINGALSMCARGLFGTTATEHKAGEKVRHLVNLFDCFQADQGSELFYQIARDTANAYNKGGFQAIYLDAMFGGDSYYGYSDMEYSFYYTAEFVREILKYCDTPPRIEYSVMTPALWYSRSCMGAWDFANRGYKPYFDLHLITNAQDAEANFLPATLGWFCSFPAASYYNDPIVDYQIHYMFDDDIDYLGAKLIATNSSLAYWMIDDATASAYPALLRNNARLALYDKLRVQNYFSDSVKEKLGKIGSEWELIETDGKYGFREKLYQKSVIASEESNRISGNNSFGASAPSLIRIEGLYTSKNGGKEVLLANLDENKSLDEQTIQFNYTSPLDLTETPALKVRIYGDGSGDYISIQLKSSPETIPGTVDHVIKLDFTGWREITLAEAMTGIYDGTVWSESWLTYVHEYRELCAHHAVVYMNVRRIGDCSDVRIDWIKAVEYEKNIIVNPSVTINGSKITFQCSLDSTSFIELKGGVAMLYSSKGNSQQINFSGTLPVIDGEYTGEFTCDSSSGSPLRAYVTVGFDGEELFDN